jgi:6,7-dimethyl-8-ribityllumazine synthase
MLHAIQDIPMIFGLLTTNNRWQTEGISRKKGNEFAIVAIKIFDFVCRFKK